MIFLQEILISPYNSSSPACHMMYFAYKLNKQGDNIQPWHIPFPMLIHSVVPCPIITVASWPVSRLLRRQVRWSGIPISLWIYQFVVIHKAKCFSVVNEATVDVFLQFPCFLYDLFWRNAYLYLLAIFQLSCLHSVTKLYEFFILEIK